MGFSHYNIFRCDRELSDNTTRGGGVLVAIHQELTSTQITTFDEYVQQSQSESLFVEVKSRQVTLLIAAVYIPSFTLVQIYKDLVNFLEEISTTYKPENIIFCGDFNLPSLLWKNNPSRYEVIQYISPRVFEAADHILHTSMLMDWQKHFPPHSRKGYTLDLLWGSSEVCQYILTSDSLVHADPEHHESAYFKINGLKSDSDFSESENKPLKNFAKVNYKVLNTLLDIDCDTLLDRNTENCVHNFYTVLNEVIQNNVPDLPKFTSTYPIWYTCELKNLIIEKKKLHIIWNESHKFQDYLQFSLIRSKCLRLSRELYLKYISEVESKVKSNLKSFWSYVHRFKKSNSLPQCTYLNDRSASGKRSICNLLADHFSSVYSKERLDDLPDKQLNDLLISMQIDELELISALSKLDDNIKSGPDGIPPYVIKKLKASLFSPLLKIFNKSLSQGIFPEIWKKSFIFPIFKDGGKSNAANYRPISIISTLAKIFESIVVKRLSEFFLRSIGIFQHGFIKRRSTLTNLLLFNDYIFNAFIKKQQVDAIYIDFSKAFDKVNHTLLLQKV